MERNGKCWVKISGRRHISTSVLVAATPMALVFAVFWPIWLPYAHDDQAINLRGQGRPPNTTSCSIKPKIVFWRRVRTYCKISWKLDPLEHYWSIWWLGFQTGSRLAKPEVVINSYEMAYIAFSSPCDLSTRSNSSAEYYFRFRQTGISIFGCRGHT